MKFTFKLLYLVLFLFITSTTFAQTKTLKVLFVGNSYIYYSNLSQLVAQISELTQTKLITKKSVVGGANLSQHWNSERGLKTKALIENGGFDIVVLQEQSLGTIQNSDRFLKNVKQFSTFIKQHGAKPYLYATWAREKIPQQQETITRVYQQAAHDNDAGIVLAGEAWKLARQQNPNIKLYIADGSHPSDLGAFLTACVFVNELSGELPNSLPNVYKIKNDSAEVIENRLYKTIDIEFCSNIISIIKP